MTDASECAKDTVVDNELLSGRLAAWREEQYVVAEQVIVLQDDDKGASLPELSERFYVSAPDTSDLLFGGVDVSFPEKEGDPAVAVYCIIQKSDFKVVYHDSETFDLTLPYVSSYLSFREIDPLERLVKKQMDLKPELNPYCILVDGNGILHERRAGIACFLGVRTGLKTIGVGKTLYCHAGLSPQLVKNGIDQSIHAVGNELRTNAEFRSQLEGHRGVIMDRAFVDANNEIDSDDGETGSAVNRQESLQEIGPQCLGLGIKLRGNDGVTWACALVGHGGKIGSNKRHAQAGTKNPIFISVGHSISLEEAVRICAELSVARIPEPVRQADLSGRQLLREAKERQKS